MDLRARRRLEQDANVAVVPWLGDLLSVPIVAAAGLFEMPKVMRAHDLHGSTMAIGLLAAAVAGYASIAWLLRFLRARSTIPFIVYRVALGLVLMALLATGRL